MSTYIYHKEENVIREKPNVPHPDTWDYASFDSQNAYESYLKTLRQFPCSDTCKNVWKDLQEVVEGKDFELKIEEVCNIIDGYSKTTTATPLTHEDEGELWKLVCEGAANYNDFDFLSWAQRHFTITRK